MKEDDMLELLKFERKQMRARIATLRSDKFIQVRLKMETGSDGKAQKVNFYFINYKVFTNLIKFISEFLFSFKIFDFQSFVNVVKYKLLMMRKKLETEERNATSRASFKCTNCLKTYTDLEVNIELFLN